MNATPRALSVKNAKNTADIASAKQMLLDDNAISALLELMDFHPTDVNHVTVIALAPRTTSAI